MRTIPRPEHPRPDFVRPNWMNLNGEWVFAFDDGKVGIAEHWFEPGRHFDRTITVPFCYRCAVSGIHDTGKHEVVWYRRAQTVPEAMQERRLLLRFGAVDFSCDVYINGLRCGGHKGGYTQLTDVQQEINGLLTPDRKPLRPDPQCCIGCLRFDNTTYKQTTVCILAYIQTAVVLSRYGVRRCIVCIFSPGI